MRLTPNQSHYVLSTLISQRKVRPLQVQAVLNGRRREMETLRERLATLQELGGVSGRGARRQRGGRKARKTAGRRRLKMSPKVRALRRLQGKYMGYVRRLKAAEKARVRTVREKQGMQAAIKLASSLSRSKKA